MAAGLGAFVDDRLRITGASRKYLNKVFPDQWSFMMGEIALYSFIVLLLTGTYLTFFFDASMGETVYHGRYVPMQGITMSKAYASTLDISFDVRGGLIVRQIHHWAALLFLAAMLIHMCRVFFTGAFRKPRELNWLVGLSMLALGLLEGFIGYSLPDDLLSGTGLRIVDSIILSVPVIGTWTLVPALRRRVPGDRDHRPVLHRPRAADPGAAGGARGRAPHAGGAPETHPVPRPRPHRGHRARRAVLPHLRG